MAEADPQKTFNVHEAKTQFSRLLERAHRGEQIVLAKDGVPWARMGPVEPVAAKRRQSGGLTLAGPLDLDAFLEPLPDEELDFIDDRPKCERH